MMSSSAFMRGEGTAADVRRSTAALREWRSCTSLFHHGDLEARRKTNDRKIEGHESHCEYTVALAQAAAELCSAWTGEGARPHTTSSPYKHEHSLTPPPPSPASSSLPDSAWSGRR